MSQEIEEGSLDKTNDSDEENPYQLMRKNDSERSNLNFNT